MKHTTGVHFVTASFVSSLHSLISTKLNRLVCIPIGREIVIPVSANFIKIHRDDREMIILKNVRNFEEFDILWVWFFKKKG